jgi:hypothetical protein
MTNYSKGVIYKFECNETGKIYFGSTVNYNQRIRKQKHDCQRWLDGKLKLTNKKTYRVDYSTSFEIIKNNNYTVSIVEEFPCKTKKELTDRERYYIQNTENVVNKNIPNRTQKEWIQDNPDKFKAIQKKWIQKHQEQICLARKEYRSRNLEKIRERQTIIVNCECGSSVQQNNISYHKKSKKHLRYINSI